MKIYGYARISRATQNIDRQVRNILSVYPDAEITKEAYTGTKVEGRTGFNKLMRKVKAGDVVVFDSVSRMSRNAEEGFALYKDCYNRGIELVFLKEQQINTSTYKQELAREFGKIETGDADTDTFVNEMLEAVNRYIMRLAERQIRIAFEQAEKEVTDLHQRTKEGIREVKARNQRIMEGEEEGEIKQIGQQKGRKLNIKKAGTAKEIIRKYSKTFGGIMTDAEVMKQAEVSKPTLYKYKKEIAEEMRAEQAER